MSYKVQQTIIPRAPAGTRKKDLVTCDFNKEIHETVEQWASNFLKTQLTHLYIVLMKKIFESVKYQGFKTTTLNILVLGHIFSHFSIM